MKKIIFTGILSLSMVLGACGTDYDEMVQEVEDANEQAGIGATSEEAQADEVAEKEKQDKAAAEKEQAEKDKAAAEKEQQEKEEKAAEEKAAKEKAEAEQAAKEEEIDLEQAHLYIMQEHMNMYVDVTFDKESKTYKMTPTKEQLITEIEMLPLGIGLDNWQDMVDGIASMSKANSDNLGEGYSITLVNPLNADNIILWVMEGEVIYNVVDEL